MLGLTIKKTTPAACICWLITLGCVIWLIILATPAKEATRIRNALIAGTAASNDFHWTPLTVPADFKLESALPPPEFTLFVEKLNISRELSDFELILEVAKELLKRERRGGAIQSSTVDALAKMQSQGTGYCSDYTQVINGLAYVLGVPVREWGMSFEGYGGLGHAFTEIFDRQLNKWIFIDVHSAFYVVDNGVPMSALEYRDALIERKNVTMVKISPDRFGFKNELAAQQFYMRGVHEMFLYWSNDVFSYDANIFVASASKVSRAVEQMVAILVGAHPKIKLYPDPESENERKKLHELKGTILALLSSLFVFGLLSLFYFFKLFSIKDRANGSRD